MKIFEYRDYRKYVNDRMAQMGRGAYRRLATELNVHTSLVSQVFSGNKELNLEQGLVVARFLGLRKLEFDYFLLMIEQARAGTQDLKKHFKEKLEEIESKALEASSRLPTAKKISESAQSIFYSHWHYSAIRLLTSIPKYQSAEKLSRYLKISLQQTHTILDFLLKHGLIVEEKGKFKIGPMRTHLPSQSPLVSRHHTNWRLRAIRSYDSASPQNFGFTSPMTLNEEDARKIHKLCLDFIESLNPIIEPSPCEKLYCLNLDWFEVSSEVEG